MIVHSVPDLLQQINEEATAFGQIYPNKVIQIQIHPTTLEFIKIYLAAQDGVEFAENEEPEEEKLFGFPLLRNKYLHGRYGIAILEEEEKIWKT